MHGTDTDVDVPHAQKFGKLMTSSRARAGWCPAVAIERPAVGPRGLADDHDHQLPAAVARRGLGVQTDHDARTSAAAGTERTASFAAENSA